MTKNKQSNRRRELENKLSNWLFKRYINLHYYVYKGKLDSKITSILQYDESDVGLSLDSDDKEEYASPGFKKYSKTGYYKIMLSRYLYTIKYIKNKIILDSGCGLGWGSYLISHYPEEIISIDINAKALDFAKKTWNDIKLNFLECSVLDIGSLNRYFDVILGMEVIEHLTSEQGKKYLEECCNNLKKGGVLILSSSFPNSEKEAQIIASRNKYHLKIFTKEEFKKISRKIGFSKLNFMGNFMVVLKK